MKAPAAGQEPAARTAAEGPDLSRRVALSVPEAARALGISERHLRSLLSDIPTVRLGSRTVIPIDALKRWLDAEAKKKDARVARAVEDLLGGLK